ncbi:MAG: STAS domain-containing protein [Calditrichaeota bacterium]|nr:STAS domain-containing protein [Calditrichota bacterium]
MRIKQENIDGVCVLRIEDARIDSSVASELKTELLRLVENEAVVSILIDLKDVEYVDSSGLGALLFGHRHVKANSGDLKLLHPNQKVRTLIRIANLEEILEGFDDEERALKSF